MSSTSEAPGAYTASKKTAEECIFVLPDIHSSNIADRIIDADIYDEALAYLVDTVERNIQVLDDEADPIEEICAESEEEEQWKKLKIFLKEATRIYIQGREWSKDLHQLRWTQLMEVVGLFVTLYTYPCRFLPKYLELIPFFSSSDSTHASSIGAALLSNISTIPSTSSTKCVNASWYIPASII